MKTILVGFVFCAVLIAALPVLVLAAGVGHVLDGVLERL